MKYKKINLSQIRILLPILGLTLFVCSANSQQVDNIDFSRGKTAWNGDGEVVYIDSAGSISETKTPNSSPAIRIKLTNGKWRSLKQRLHAKGSESEIRFSIQVKADKDFKPLPKSRAYSDVDFKEGGQYVWSGKVFPKCSFLVRATDEAWHYRPLRLSSGGDWKTFSITFSDLKARQREIEFLLPPGDGIVYIKGP